MGRKGLYPLVVHPKRQAQSQSEAKPDLGLKARYPKKGASPQPEPAHLKLRRFHPCAAGISPCHRQHSFKTPSPSSCPGSLLPALGQKPLPHWWSCVSGGSWWHSTVCKCRLSLSHGSTPAAYHAGGISSLHKHQHHRAPPGCGLSGKPLCCTCPGGLGTGTSLSSGGSAPLAGASQGRTHTWPSRFGGLNFLPSLHIALYASLPLHECCLSAEMSILSHVLPSSFPSTVSPCSS